MIPSSNISTNLTVVETEEVNKTYKVYTDKIQGKIDGLDALEQAIYKVLNTEKYEHQIYSFNYGIDFQSLLGKDSIYVKMEMKRRIQECLLQDSRIESVDDFSFKVSGDEIVCEFVVTSKYGDIKVTKEVNN